MPSQPRSNPWLTIWTKPRATLLAIVRDNPSYGFFFLCFVYGFVAVLGGAQQVSLGNATSGFIILLVSALLGFFVGYLALSIQALVLKWTGSWIGGKASYKEIRAAVAWSNVPAIVDIALWIITTFIFGSALFTQDFSQNLFFGTPGGHVFILTGIARLVLGIWSIVILLIGLSAVQKFSVIKAIFNALFAFLIVGAIFWLGTFIAIWLQEILQR